MLVKHELEKMLSKLLEENYAQLHFEGLDLTLKILDQKQNFSLSTPVYFGGNYIPMSVRKSLREAGGVHKNIETSLDLDESKFTISLNYTGMLHSGNKEEFKYLIEEFAHQAHEWREFFDEHDKHDLIYIYSKK